MPLLLRWLARRSLRLLHAAGAVAGWTAYAASPSYRRRLNANAALAGVPRAARRAAIAEAGKLVLELPRLWLRPQGERIGDTVTWDGAEIVDAALDAGRGLVFLTPHMGCFEVCAQSYAERWGARQPVTVLYRPARQPWLRELERVARDRPALATAPATLAGVRQMMRALKRGESLGLLPDQVPPEGMGVWAPFFGQPAYTMTLAARLVLQTGSAVCLIWGERLPRGAGYRIRVRELPQPLPARAPGVDEAAWMTAAATVVNRSMEALIAEHPAQYLWGYHRYKQPRPAEVAA